jgi:hypothetical protein
MLRCPNASEYKYVNESFVEKLRSAEEKGVAYVGDVRLLRMGQVKDLKEGFRGAAAAPAFPGIGENMTGEARSVEEAAVDPATGEVMRDDWLFQGTIAVVLGEKPQPLPGAAGAGAPMGNPPPAAGAPPTDNPPPAPAPDPGAPPLGG